MTADEVTAIASSALFLIIKVAAPLRDISDAYIAWKLDINRIVRLYSNALVGF